MSKKYTNEKNIQMLIYLLKANDIKKIIVNPGTMNMSFVASVQNDDFFEMYSCVDERSACYMACGLAAESGEPVVLTCTGATASRNYMPGLTEAFYRKLPVLAITCTPHLGNIGQNIAQMLDRRANLNDTYKFSTYVPPIKSSLDEWSDNVSINNAILELKRHGGGPVQINLGTEITKVFDTDELPKFRKINRYLKGSILPTIKEGQRIGIYVGNHKIWNKELAKYVDEFCERYNAVVLCDQTSNYFGKYKILFNILCDQEKYITPLTKFDLILHIGDTSGSYMIIDTNSVWRINPDGEIRDTFKKLENVFEMEEIDFFKYYSEIASNNTKNITLYENLKSEIEELESRSYKIDFPFSNIWITRELINKIPNESTVHLAILNTLRSWNYFSNKNSLKCYCNTGGFGIDGILSTLIGASFNNKKENYYCIIGDLAFFYDMNSLGNRDVGNNLRIILINNGCGTEFHNYSHPANVIGDDNISKFIAANGHFGNKSKYLVKNYVEDLGFEYISSSTKEEFEKHVDYFTSNEIYEKPILFEIFTNSEDESEALHLIRNMKSSTKGIVKDKIRKILPNDAKNKIKKILGR